MTSRQLRHSTEMLDAALERHRHADNVTGLTNSCWGKYRIPVFEIRPEPDSTGILKTYPAGTRTG